MATIKNGTNQPIYLNLISGKSLKIAARSMTEIDEHDLHSPELGFYQRRGDLLVLEQPAFVQTTQAQPTTAEIKPSRKGGQ